MISREDFVGTIIGAEGDEPLLLTEFVGEGSTAVVFGVAPPEDPSGGKHVVKFFKPRAFLEMDVLHHSLRIHEELYPDHPLLLRPEDRMKRLTEEMLARVDSSRFEFRVELYRGIMETVIQGLALGYSDRCLKGDLEPAHLLEEATVIPRLDENLLYRVQELLDEDNIVEDFVPFFEFLADALPAVIQRLKQEERYHPFSSNVLYNLLGLYFEDFINKEELDHIAGDARIHERIDYDTLLVLWQFVTILYHRAVDLIRILSEEEANAEPKAEDDLAEEMRQLDLQEKHGNISSIIRGAALGCELVDRFASTDRWNSRRLQGLSRYWYGKSLELTVGNEEVSRQAFEAALAQLTDTADLGERHDVLLDLGRILSRSDSDAAEGYLREAIEIEKGLGVPPEHRTRLELSGQSNDAKQDE